MATTKARAGARGWVTRTGNTLENICDNQLEDIDVSELSEAIDNFDIRLSNLDSAQAKVELQLKLKDLDSDIEEAYEFRTNAKIPRLKAAKIFAKLRKSSDEVSSASSSYAVEAKLPKLELPKFSGDPTEWQCFWDQFCAIIDSSEMPDVSKFTYLQSLLQGEAKSAIQGLSLTSANYHIARDILTQRFGRKERIIFAHIQDLLNVTVPKQSSVTVLWKLQDTLQAHIRSLETLNISGKEYGVILTPLILSRLPSDIRLEWARDGEGHENDLEWLLAFLQTEIKRRERSQSFDEQKSVTPTVIGTEKRFKPVNTPATAAALQTTSTTDICCNFCGKRHVTEKCWNLTKVPLADRKLKIQSSGLCFRCLNKGHLAKGCSEKCTKCKGYHHDIICTAKSGKMFIQKETPTSPVSVQIETPTLSYVGVCHDGTSNNQSKVPVTKVLLQTAHVTILCENGKNVQATVLLDTGSDRSYIRSELINKVDPKWVGVQTVSYAAFGSGQPSKGQMRNVYEIKLKCQDQSFESVVVTEIPVICAPVYTPEIPVSVMKSLGGLTLSADHAGSTNVTIDILIGLDTYWKLMRPGVVNVSDGLVAQETVFGWVLSGVLTNNVTSCVTQSVISHQLLCLNNIPDEVVRSFWDLTPFGVLDQMAESVHPVYKKFESSISFSEGRYEVALPWKSGHGSLQNNRKLALKRLDGLTKRLTKDPDLSKRYCDAISELESLGVIEEVPQEELISPNPTYYMPHHPVVRESKVTTKVRPVFDASAPSYNGVSLNDCLETGPSLTPNIVDVLVRFRRWKVALTSDITKAFLQIKVNKADRDVHRFLWDVNDQVRDMRFTRVPFGNKSSPFLLNATIKHHLQSVPRTRVVSELLENLYVDDWLTGSDTDEEGCAMLEEAIGVMQGASMELAKCSSNSSVVTQKMYQLFEEKYLDFQSQKVLGMQWSTVTDHFSFDGIAIPDGIVLTKRVLLSLMVRLFDPLGFLTPFTMLAKILFQDLWRLGISWDDVVPNEHGRQFLFWLNGTNTLKHWYIPRSYSGHMWSENTKICLHAFGDASEKGYGACVYIVCWLKGEKAVSSLIVSKARVAPLKRVTLPRLELLGALLCAQLLVFVKKTLKLENDVEYHCWSDSMVALAWIKSDPNKWKTFVANRVVQIQELTDPSCWAFCSGKVNPADLVTRGIHAEELVKSQLWLNGPAFILEEEGSVDVPTVDHDQCELLEELPLKVSSLVSVHRNPELLDDKRWSTFLKAIRVIGWVLRFIYNMRNAKLSRRLGDLSLDEMTAAKIQYFHHIQSQAYEAEIRDLSRNRSVSRKSSIVKLRPFLSEDGFVRVGSRLQFSHLPYNEKFPIVLPKCHLSLLLVKFQHRLLNHVGVPAMINSLRCNYWIVGVRRLAKQIKRECVSCKRHDSRPCVQPVAPLPQDRITRSPPFAVTGLDHAGPLYCADFPKRKFYILLFTCAVVRAVHLELVNSLSLDDFMLALRRFVARRGLPEIIYSDNAKTFVAAERKLLQVFGHVRPVWKFIVPRSPWWGGWWERMVKSVKVSLRKSLGTRSLTRCELETSLHEVESCINARPLTFVGDEVEYSTALTPNNFLVGKPTGPKLSTLLSPDQPVTAVDLKAMQSIQNHLLDHFWSLWSSEYIKNLPLCHGPGTTNNITEGSVVLVREQDTRRSCWPLGLVKRVLPSRDGLVRALEIKTQKGTYIRPIQLLHNLELNVSDDEHCNVEPDKSVKSQKPDSSESDLPTKNVNESDLPTKNVNESDLPSKTVKKIKIWSGYKTC